MPLVASYTEAQLAAYLVGGSRAAVAGLMAWTAGSDAVQEAVSRVERILGFSDIATATDMASVEAVGRLVFWRGAKAGLAPLYDETMDNESRKRSQMWDHIVAMLHDAEADCADLGIPGVGGSGTVYIHPVERSEDYLALPAATGAEF